MGLDNNDYRDFLMHYGVKGMRWGKRKSKYVDDEYIKNLTANSQKNSYPSGFKSASSLKTRPKPNSLWSEQPSSNRRKVTKPKGSFVSKRITGSFYKKEAKRDSSYSHHPRLGGHYSYFANGRSPKWRKQIVDWAQEKRRDKDRAELAMKNYYNKSLAGIAEKTLDRGRSFISKLFKRKK